MGKLELLFTIVSDHQRGELFLFAQVHGTAAYQLIVVNRLMVIWFLFGYLLDNYQAQTALGYAFELCLLPV